MTFVMQLPFHPRFGFDTAMATEITRPPDKLVGLKTKDGWTIESLVNKAVYQTGGAFSTGYIVRHDDGRLGFFKALDFGIAERAADKMRALESLTRSYNFERDVLKLCAGENLSKVVVAISDGSIEVKGAPFDEVYYLIFELADGDIRKHAVLNSQFSSVWILRALHQLSIGISQLHSVGIYHQDIKPSNILVFEKQSTSKLADLGRSHCETIEAPHDIFSIPGARSYAPPEQLYNFQMSERLQERASADLYMLGSMMYFLFGGGMLTPAIVAMLKPEHRPPIMSHDDGGWRGYFEDVLPYLQAAYGEATEEFSASVSASLTAIGHGDLAAELTSLFQYLTDPHPRRRGHPREHALMHSNNFDLRRFTSAFNRIATQAEFKLGRH